jgi:hypothetical protein
VVANPRRDVHGELELLGFDVESLHGVGVLSGLPIEPMGDLLQPSQSDPAKLLELELAAGDEYVDCGRYILAIARKRGPQVAT